MSAGASLIPYPFTRVKYTAHQDDGEGGYTAETKDGWRPGCYSQYSHDEAEHRVADGWGHLMLIHCGSFQPIGRNLRERTFYQRRWIDPDGKVFGKTTLRVTTTTNFLHMAAGYRFHDEVEMSQK